MSSSLDAVLVPKLNFDVLQHLMHQVCSSLFALNIGNFLVCPQYAHVILTNVVIYESRMSSLVIRDIVDMIELYPLFCPRMSV